MTVSIIGLGLMGGSMALAMKKNSLAKTVYGFNNNPQNAQVALELGLVDKLVTLEESTKADILILAVPVEASVEILNIITPINPNITIIDLGSTKEKISKSCPPSIRKNFVAAHPMTGTEYSGPRAAKADLYEDKTVVLCDLDKSGVKQVEVARDLFSRLQMKTVEMDSDIHDVHAAFISHLPHMISFSIANTVLNQEDPENILTLAAGGFKDMSRLAKSSPVMWREIFVQNRQNMLECLSAFKQELSKFEEALKSGDTQKLTNIMQDANELYKIFK